jgi:MOSC domain
MRRRGESCNAADAMNGKRERTRAAVLARLLGVEPGSVPGADEEQRAWLAERGLGIAPVADPARFAWAGPWIAERAGPDGVRAVLMFGVPSGELFAPAGGGGGEIVAGWLVAPLDVERWRPRTEPAADPGHGVVEAIVLAPGRAEPVRVVAEARAVPGRGLEHDRYHDARGTFASGRPGSALTLVDAAVLDELGPIDHRRNVVVRGIDLAALIGRDFRLGEIVCHGCRHAEPCAHLDRLNGGGILRPLVHRGGLRADILSAGSIRVGDTVAAI